MKAARIGRPAFWLAVAGLLLASFVLRAAAPEAVWLVGQALILTLWLPVAGARARDMGQSGWFGLITLFPLAGLAVVGWLGASRPGWAAAAAEDAANAAVLATFEQGPCWLSVLEIAERAAGDWEATILRVRQLDAKGTLTNNGLQGRERRYRIG